MAASDLNPERLVEIAYTLLDLAGSLDVGTAGSQVLSNPQESAAQEGNSVRSIDKLGPLLASVASLEYQARTHRNELMGGDLFGEPAWDMLLDLFIRTVEGKKTPVTSLCIASRVPLTTALRYIAELEKRGMIVRVKSHFDQRTSYLSLSDDAFVKIGTYLRKRHAATGYPRRTSLRALGLLVDPLLVDQLYIDQG